MDESYELIDIANREARFALIMAGALNAVLFVVGTRTELLASIPSAGRVGMGLGLVAYAALTVHFFMQAIETLRPRKYQPRLPELLGGAAETHPAGVRYYEDVVRRDAEGHWRAWGEVRISQLNAELAVQGHSLALKNRAKYAALRRLYSGLSVMTLLAAGMMTVLAFFAIVY